MSTLSDLKNIEQHLRNAKTLSTKVRGERHDEWQNATQESVLVLGERWTIACRQDDRIAEALGVALAEVRREEQRLSTALGRPFDESAPR